MSGKRTEPPALTPWPSKAVDCSNQARVEAFTQRRTVLAGLRRVAERVRQNQDTPEFRWFYGVYLPAVARRRDRKVHREGDDLARLSWTRWSAKLDRSVYPENRWLGVMTEWGFKSTPKGDNVYPPTARQAVALHRTLRVTREVQKAAQAVKAVTNADAVKDANEDVVLAINLAKVDDAVESTAKAMRLLRERVDQLALENAELRTQLALVGAEREHARAELSRRAEATSKPEMRDALVQTQGLLGPPPPPPPPTSAVQAEQAATEADVSLRRLAAADGLLDQIRAGTELRRRAEPIEAAKQTALVDDVLSALTAAVLARRGPITGNEMEENDSEWADDEEADSNTIGLLMSLAGAPDRACLRCGIARGVACAGCDAVYYCTESCQNADWVRHQARCVPLQ